MLRLELRSDVRCGSCGGVAGIDIVRGMRSHRQGGQRGGRKGSGWRWRNLGGGGRVVGSSHDRDTGSFI